jgi:hypothetical protein
MKKTFQFVESEAARLLGDDYRVFAYARFNVTMFAVSANHRERWYGLSCRGHDGELQVVCVRSSPDELLAAIKQRAAA